MSHILFQPGSRWCHRTLCFTMQLSKFSVWVIKLLIKQHFYVIVKCMAAWEKLTLKGKEWEEASESAGEGTKRMRSHQHPLSDVFCLHSFSNDPLSFAIHALCSVHERDEKECCWPMCSSKGFFIGSRWLPIHRNEDCWSEIYQVNKIICLWIGHPP